MPRPDPLTCERGSNLLAPLQQRSRLGNHLVGRDDVVSKRNHYQRVGSGVAVTRKVLCKLLRRSGIGERLCGVSVELESVGELLHDRLDGSTARRLDGGTAQWELQR
jgi:hypothetical protein